VIKIWRQKTRVLGLPDGEEIMTLAFLVLTPCHANVVKDARPVGLPAMGNKRHGVQGSTPVSEGCDHYYPQLLSCSALDLHYAI